MITGCLNCGHDYDPDTQGLICPHETGEHRKDSLPPWPKTEGAQTEPSSPKPAPPLDMAVRILKILQAHGWVDLKDDRDLLDATVLIEKALAEGALPSELKADTLVGIYCGGNAEQLLVDFGKINWEGWQRLADWLNKESGSSEPFMSAEEFWPEWLKQTRYPVKGNRSAIQVSYEFATAYKEAYAEHLRKGKAGQEGK